MVARIEPAASAPHQGSCSYAYPFEGVLVALVIHEGWSVAVRGNRSDQNSRARFRDAQSSVASSGGIEPEVVYELRRINVVLCPAPPREPKLVVDSTAK